MINLIKRLFGRSKYKPIKATSFGCAWCDGKFENEFEATEHYKTHLTTMD